MCSCFSHFQQGQCSRFHWDSISDYTYHSIRQKRPAFGPRSFDLAQKFCHPLQLLGISSCSWNDIKVHLMLRVFFYVSSNWLNTSALCSWKAYELCGTGWSCALSDFADYKLHKLPRDRHTTTKFMSSIGIFLWEIWLNGKDPTVWKAGLCLTLLYIPGSVLLVRCIFITLRGTTGYYNELKVGP